MKKLLSVIALAALASSAVTTANADVHFVPEVGYVFQNTATQNKQQKEYGSFQQNRATFGAQVVGDVGDKGTQVGVEYLRVNANNNSDQVGVIVNQDIKHGFYLTGGVGYYKMETKYPVLAEVDKLPDGSLKNFYDQKTKRAFESPYVNLGVGYKYQVTNMITLKAEVREQYITDKNYFTPQALVGFDFNLDQINKPFSYK